jgi:hypothetical protein
VETKAVLSTARAECDLQAYKNDIVVSGGREASFRSAHAAVTVRPHLRFPPQQRRVRKAPRQSLTAPAADQM